MLQLEKKVCKDLQYVSIKVAQGDLQKCITWLNFFGKGKEEWEKACVNSSFPQKKLNTQVKTMQFLFF